MRFRSALATLVALLGSTFASAQPKDAGPAVELRLRSVNDLLDRAEYVAGLAGNEAAIGQARDFLKSISIEGKGIQGIDPKRPVGAYARLETDIKTSPFVFMVPISDQKTFLDALQTHLNVTTEKGDDGTLKAAVPLINQVHLRFANEYLYIAPNAGDLDVKKLVAPKTYFGKDDGSFASLVVHIERVPADLRKFAFGQLELGLAEERKKNENNESAAEKKLKGVVFDGLLGGGKGILEDGKSLSLKLFADAKSDDVTVELVFAPKTGTPTAKNVTALGEKKSLPAGIVAAAGPSAARVGASATITDGMQKEYAAAVRALLEQALKDAPADGKDVFEALVAAVSPTLTAGNLDATAALLPADDKGRHALIGAVAVKEGKGIETFVKKTIEQYGQFIENEVVFKFDVETVGDFALHKVELKNAPEKFEKVFGTGNIWLATSADHIAFSIEADGDVLRKALKAKPAATPALTVELAASQLLKVAQPDLKPDELKALLKDAFGDGPAAGKDTIRVSVTGGTALTAKVSAKGKALRMFLALGLLKGN
jgi:hypothetical protein